MHAYPTGCGFEQAVPHRLHDERGCAIERGLYDDGNNNAAGPVHIVVTDDGWGSSRPVRE